MENKTAIDKLYEDAKAVIKTLEREAEISLLVTVGDHFRKALLLAAASYFERRVSESVLEFVRERSAGSDLLENFVRNMAVQGKYHTWFNWDGRNANKFFSFFGDEFGSKMKEQVRLSLELQAAIESFLQLGNERNRLVHQDYATFPLDETLDEIYALYRNARTFVEGLPNSLRDATSG